MKNNYGHFRFGVTFLLLMLALASFGIAAADISITTDKASYTVGEPITVTVSMNTAGVPARDTRLYIGSSSTAATFISGTGTNGVFFSSLGTAPQNTIASGRWHFYSGASTPSVSNGDSQTVFTFRMTAAAAGSVTLSIDSPNTDGSAAGSSVINTVGPPPRFTRTYHVITSAPSTITISAAAPDASSPCTEADWTLEVGECSVSRTGATTQRVTATLNSATCTGGVQYPPVSSRSCELVPCIAQAATCDQAGVTCPGNVAVAATACPAGQTCTDHVCSAPAATSRRQQLINQINAIPEGEIPTTWNPSFISRMAGILRGIFG